ncbi:MAG TPA: hypothetical protein VHM88_10990, partial [Candidatus Acidoferrales bacterium]|nr:hypothetical protein [Candidatus Acidoferrales bacterium]
VSARKLRDRVGKRFTALLEGSSKENEWVWEARLEGMAPEIDGKLYITDVEAPPDRRAPQAGDVVTVEVTESHPYDLVGRVVEVVEAAPEVASDGLLPDRARNAVRHVSSGAPLRVLA